MILKSITLSILILSSAFLVSCNHNRTGKDTRTKENVSTTKKTLTLVSHSERFDPDLPTFGLLMYDGVLQSEVIATSDVFAKPSKGGHQLFNVVSIAEAESPITTEEGMHFVPDYTFKNCPKLTVLFVPSAYDMYAQVHNAETVEFIRRKNAETNMSLVTAQVLS